MEDTPLHSLPLGLMGGGSRTLPTLVVVVGVVVLIELACAQPNGPVREAWPCKWPEWYRCLRRFWHRCGQSGTCPTGPGCGVNPNWEDARRFLRRYVKVGAITDKQKALLNMKEAVRESKTASSAEKKTRLMMRLGDVFDAEQSEQDAARAADLSLDAAKAAVEGGEGAKSILNAPESGLRMAREWYRCIWRHCCNVTFPLAGWDQRKCCGSGKPPLQVYVAMAYIDAVRADVAIEKPVTDAILYANEAGEAAEKAEESADGAREAVLTRGTLPTDDDLVGDEYRALDEPEEEDEGGEGEEGTVHATPTRRGARRGKGGRKGTRRGKKRRSGTTVCEQEVVQCCVPDEPEPRPTKRGCDPS